MAIVGKEGQPLIRRIVMIPGQEVRLIVSERGTVLRINTELDVISTQQLFPTPGEMAVERLQAEFPETFFPFVRTSLTIAAHPIARGGEGEVAGEEMEHSYAKGNLRNWMIRARTEGLLMHQVEKLAQGAVKKVTVTTNNGTINPLGAAILSATHALLLDVWEITPVNGAAAEPSLANA